MLLQNCLIQKDFIDLLAIEPNRQFHFRQILFHLCLFGYFFNFL